MNDIVNNLTNEIRILADVVDEFNYHEEKMKGVKYSENLSEPIETRLKKQETYYDKLYETYWRTNMVVESETKMKKEFDDFMKLIGNDIEKCKQLNEEIGNKLNNMLNEMKPKEKNSERIQI